MQRLEAEAEALERAGPEILEQHVGVATSARKLSRSVAALRSSTMLRLLRFHSMKGAPSPSTKGGMRRASSPSPGARS